MKELLQLDEVRAEVVGQGDGRMYFIETNTYRATQTVGLKPDEALQVAQAIFVDLGWKPFAEHANELKRLAAKALQSHIDERNRLTTKLSRLEARSSLLRNQRDELQRENDELTKHHGLVIDLLRSVRHQHLDAQRTMELIFDKEEAYVGHTPDDGGDHHGHSC